MQDLDLAKKKLFIFDLDGTLIDSVGDPWINVEKEILLNLGWDIEDDITFEEKFNYRLSESYKHDNVFMKFAEISISQYNIDMGVAEYYDYRLKNSKEIVSRNIPFRDKAPEFLKLLQETNKKIAVGTMSNRDIFDIFATAESHTQLFDLNKMDLVMTEDDVVKYKPEPDIYNKIVRTMGIDKKDVVIIEDSLGGVLAGRNAGIDTIAIKENKSIPKEVEY